MDQIIVIYKPKGPTSHDVVDEVRRVTGVRKVGHAGTLDPLATGVLVVGIGRPATKRLGEIVKKEKEYVATVKLGQTSTTDDEEGKKSVVKVDEIPAIDQVKLSFKDFIGQIKQVPPAYSAVKIGGKTAYRLARQGKRVVLGPRSVTIQEIELIDYDWPLLKVGVTTGSGVYIRSLARDLGKKLSVGGYLAVMDLSGCTFFLDDILNYLKLGIL